MDEFNLVPPEIRLTSYKLDDSYEYAEMAFSAVTKSLIMENAKQLPTMTEDDPRREKITQIVKYYDKVQELGWECYEIVQVEQLREVRRFRRKRH